MDICLFRQNFPTKYLYSETIYQNALVLKTQFLEIRVMKNSIFGNLSYVKSNFKKKNHITQVPCKISHITRISSNQVFN